MDPDEGKGRIRASEMGRRRGGGGGACLGDSSVTLRASLELWMLSVNVCHGVTSKTGSISRSSSSSDMEVVISPEDSFDLLLDAR